MRRSTVLEALLRLCGSKEIGSAGSPQLRAPPRLMVAAAAVGATAAAGAVVGLAAGAAVAGAAGAVVGAAGFGASVGFAAGASVGAAAGGAAGAQAAASTPIAPPTTVIRKWRRLEGCMHISPFIG